MTNSSVNQRKYNDQIYAIGNFIVKFENIIDLLRTTIPFMIANRNDYEKQARSIQILLEGLTSDQIRTKWDCLIAEHFKGCNGLIQTNSKLSKTLLKIIPIRNSIAHGTFRFPIDDSSDFFSLTHPKSTKKGYEERRKVVLTESMDKLNNEMDILVECYLYIRTITNFYIGGDRTINEKSKLIYEDFCQNIDELLKNIDFTGLESHV